GLLLCLAPERERERGAQREDRVLRLLDVLPPLACHALNDAGLLRGGGVLGAVLPGSGVHVVRLRSVRRVTGCVSWWRRVDRSMSRRGSRSIAAQMRYRFAMVTRRGPFTHQTVETRGMPVRVATVETVSPAAAISARSCWAMALPYAAAYLLSMWMSIQYELDA